MPTSPSCITSLKDLPDHYFGKKKKKKILKNKVTLRTISQEIISQQNRGSSGLGLGFFRGSVYGNLPKLASKDLELKSDRAVMSE